MTDRTTNRHYSIRAGYQRQAVPLADGVTIGIGALVQTESGYLNHWDGTGPFCGILTGGDSDIGSDALTGDTSTTPPPEGRVALGAVLTRVPVAAADASSSLVYCEDSDIANLTAADSVAPPVGAVIRFGSASDCDVQLFSPEQWQAGIASGDWAT